MHTLVVDVRAAQRQVRVGLGHFSDGRQPLVCVLMKVSLRNVINLSCRQFESRCVDLFAIPAVGRLLDSSDLGLLGKA